MVHALVDGQQGWLQFFAVVNKTAENIGVQIALLSAIEFPEWMPRSETAGLQGSTMFNVLRNSKLISTMALLISTSTNSK